MGMMSCPPMTKTIFGKKLLIIATITVLATSLMMIGTLNDAQAKTNNLKCNNIVGSFTPPPATTPFLFTSSVGNCTSFGAVSLAGVFIVTGMPSFDCVTLTSVVDSYVIAKSGDNVLFSSVLTQCFTDASGTPVSALAPFCTTPADIASSTITGSIVVTGSIDNGLPITAGARTLNALVNHCDPTAPFGNSSVGSITGTFTV